MHVEADDRVMVVRALRRDFRDQLDFDAADADSNELRSNIDQFNRTLKKITGQQKTFRLQNEKIGRFGFSGIRHLIDSRAEGQLHSGKLCQSLLRLVQSMDVTILNNLEITGYEKVNGHLLLHTPHSFPLIASQLLVCTNAFARQLLPQLFPCQFPAAKRLTIPMLFLQGERDFQVTMKDFDLWKSSLTGRSNAAFRAYPALNHLFLAGEGKSSPAEYRVPGNFNAQAISDIANWLLAQKH